MAPDPTVEYADGNPFGGRKADMLHLKILDDQLLVGFLHPAHVCILHPSALKKTADLCQSVDHLGIHEDRYFTV